MVGIPGGSACRRFFTWSWRYLSRQLVEIEVLPPDSLPYAHSPPQRFDTVAVSNYEAFQAEATMMRGL